MRLSSPATRFLLYTYFFSWGLWVMAIWTRGSTIHIYWFGSRYDLPFFDMLMWAGGFGPGIVALFMTGVREDSASLWSRLANWRVGEMWYSLALFLPIFVVLIAIVAHAASGGKVYLATSPGYWALFLVVQLLLAPFFEELGWRGHLLPMLLEGKSPLQASLILGGAWGLWHLPVRWSQYSGQLYDFLVFFLIYCSLVTALSVVFTWFFLRTHGAIFPVVLLHASYNAMVTFVVNPTADAQGLGCVLWLTATMSLAAAITYWRGGLQPTLSEMPHERT